MSAVETRGQKQRGEIKITLKLHEPINDISPEQIKHYQLSDESLRDIRQKEMRDEIIDCKDGSTVNYFIKQGLYYRQYRNGGEVLK